jgi:1,2-diacylglycerol 3-alpha-glucosyltransferase
VARLGILGMWTMNRGAGVVNQRLYQALTDLGHEVSVFARMGSVYGLPLQQNTGLCDVPRLHLHPRYEVEPNTLRTWAQQAKLDAVLFAEEYDFSLPMTVQRTGMKTIQWVDAYVAASWRPLLKFYDQLWCITHRTENILLDWRRAAQTQYIGWGVPDNMFPAVDAAAPRYDFFHSAGWIGIDARKGTDTLLAAIGLMTDDPPEVVIHCQVPEDEAKKLMGYGAGFPSHVIWEDRDVPPPGIYEVGRVVVQPSKIEGIGLSLPEAMCTGRPIITVNAPPMTEFVTAETGWLVDVDSWRPHVDGSLYQQAIVRPEVLAKAMQEARSASNEMITEKSRLTLDRAHNLFDWELFKGKLAAGLERIGLG